jgi:hypothetical protein
MTQSKILVRYKWVCTHTQADLAWLRPLKLKTSAPVKKFTKPNTFKVKRVPKKGKHLTQ